MNSYANPVAAVFPGWLILVEPVGVRTFHAAMILIAVVAIITTQRGKCAVKNALRKHPRSKLRGI